MNLQIFIRPIHKIIAIALIILTSGCKKFVEVNPPKTQLVRSTVFTNNSTAIAAQSVIYSQITGISSQFVMRLGLSADEFLNYDTYEGTLAQYQNSLTPSINISSSIWTNAYKYIYEANAVLEGLNNSSGVTPNVKNQLTGEAKFIRAYWYYYLAALWGDVPLLTTTDYNANSKAPRTSNSEVLQFIVNDLKDAQNLLSSNFLGADCITSTTERLRPTKWAASALLARVYLFMKDWTSAEAQATSVISNNSMFDILPNLNNVFLKNSKEAILQFSAGPTFNTTDGADFVLTYPPYLVSLSPNILSAFELNDNRKSHWVGQYIDVSDTFYFPYKYKVQYSSTVSEYLMALRLAEQYLIRAEARANGAGTGLSGAIADVSKIRTRAGLAIYSGPVDKDSILNAILQERQVEFFAEWGHRWLDLKRTGAVNSVMNIVTPQKGGIWKSYQQLYPVPQSEININKNLNQNPGY